MASAFVSTWTAPVGREAGDLGIEAERRAALRGRREQRPGCRHRLDRAVARGIGCACGRREQARLERCDLRPLDQAHIIAPGRMSPRKVLELVVGKIPDQAALPGDAERSAQLVLEPAILLHA